eukprot:SAG11_NODE_8336_length_1027_cov_1.038793_2_plen_71_part_01
MKSHLGRSGHHTTSIHDAQHNIMISRDNVFGRGRQGDLLFTLTSVCMVFHTRVEGNGGLLAQFKKFTRPPP